MRSSLPVLVAAGLLACFAPMALALNKKPPKQTVVVMKTTQGDMAIRFFRDKAPEHVKNFLDCVRTRRHPNGDVYVGHRSAQASHLGNIAYVEKRRLKFDPGREEILPL